LNKQTNQPLTLFCRRLLLALLINFACYRVFCQNQPEIIFLKDRPEAQKTIVPPKNQPDRTYPKITNKGLIYIELQPPEVNPLPVVCRNLITLDNNQIVSTESDDQSASGMGFFRNYTTDDGLALDAVFCSLKDQFGNLWFGTAGGGISRFNGKTFTNFNKSNGLPNDNVFCLAEDKKGNIWIGTYGGGLACYDGNVFTVYSRKQGLLSSFINCIFIDKEENIWIGSEDKGVFCIRKEYLSPVNGKIKAEGKNIFVNITSTHGLAENKVKCITQDKMGNIWIGTQNNGVSCWNAKYGVELITESKSGKLPADLFKNYYDKNGQASNAVYSIVEDNNGYLWLGMFGGGIYCFNPYADYKAGNTLFAKYSFEHGLVSNYVRIIFKDRKGNLWIGTRDGGVSCIEITANDGLKNVKGVKYPGNITITNFSVLQGLTNNNVRSISEDKTGNLWFCTGDGGISRYNGKSFINYTTKQGLANNYVRCIFEDKEGNLWFGTWKGGVSCFDRRTFVTYTINQGLASNYINSIIQDRKGNIWFASESGGVSCLQGQGEFPLKEQSFTNYTSLQGLPSNNIRTLFEDSKGNIWFGTLDKGLSCFDGNSFTNYSAEQGLTHQNINSISEDKNGTLWFGSEGGGLYSFNIDKFSQSKTACFNNYKATDGLSGDIIYCVHVDKKGNLWVGSDGGGISLLKKEELDILYKTGETGNKKPHFISITTGSAESDNVIKGIVEYKNDIMAVGTSKGLILLIPVEKFQKIPALTTSNNGYIVKEFNSKTGFPVKDINGNCNNHGALYCDNKGMIWAGTGSDRTALVRINLGEIMINNAPPLVVLNNIRLNNDNLCWNNLLNDKKNPDSLALINEEMSNFGHKLTDAERNLMKKKYRKLSFQSLRRFYFIPENLVIPYKFNNISFEYSAIDPSGALQIKYQYMLEGYDKEWSPLTDKTSASFGNIYEGTYTFKLRACNADNIWSEPVTYTFRVLPPWYRNWWMYLVYLGLLVLIVRLYILRRDIFHKNEKEILEQKVRLRTIQLQKANEEIKENIAIVEKTAQVKQQFLANVSHEIRTPMNVIMGMLNLVKETNLNKTQSDYIETIYSASENLLNIINDILDLNKIEAGKMSLKYQTFDIIEIIGKIKKLFEETARNKGIEFNVQIKNDVDRYVKADEKRIIQIVSNLVSNAIKFTRCGSVDLKLSVKEKEGSNIVFLIEVSDTGIGITEEDQKRLFSLFSQLDNTLTRRHEGTGLGLVISKELAELLGGEIGVKSEYNKGSTFWFTFKAMISDENNLTKESDNSKNFSEMKFDIEVLLVEDKPVNQKVEKLILENIGCKVSVAGNGKEAVDMVTAGNKYDLIFMDIQMPVMDGVEAVNILRKQYKYLPPVIGLSANALEGDAEKYIRLGMDDYISKPFTPQQLKEKIYKWTNNSTKN